MATKLQNQAAGPAAPAAIRARFLRAIDSDITAFILPALASADAAERAAFAGLVLSRMAADNDVVPPALAGMEGAFEQALAEAVAALGESDMAARIAAVAGEIAASDAPADARVFALRTLLTDCLRLLSEQGAVGQVEAIGALERRWRRQQDAQLPNQAKADAGPSIYDRVTPETVTAYLKDQYPDSPAIAASAVEVLAGGRSKKTAFFTLEATDALPSSVVMRQDTGLEHIGTRLSEEEPIVRALAGRGLPVAEIHHFEPDWTALGGPFLLMQRLAGKQAGSFAAFAETNPAFLADVARTLAKLHTIDPQTLSLPDPMAGLGQGERLRKLVACYWKQWRDHAIEPSPLIDYAFDWVARRCDLPLKGNAIVHGDYRPHNFLVEGAQLTGIVDWEFAHIGDPAEDLAYIRPTVTPLMAWPDFVAHYQAAGGQPCDDEVLRLYDVWGVVRLAAMGAGAARSFLDGASDDFPQGAGGYFVLPMFERQLAALLD